MLEAQVEHVRRFQGDALPRDAPLEGEPWYPEASFYRLPLLCQVIMEAVDVEGERVAGLADRLGE